MRIYIYLGIALAVIGAMGLALNAAYRAGKDAARVEQAETVREKLNDSSIADTAITRCLADPACRLRDDGFKRK